MFAAWMDLLYEGPGDRRIELHASPPPGFVDLVARTVWGTGAVRYAMRDLAERLRGGRPPEETFPPSILDDV